MMEWLKKLFHVKEQPKVVLKHCFCGQDVNVFLYDKKVKAHKIGFVRRKSGGLVVLYCNGKEV